VRLAVPDIQAVRGMIRAGDQQDQPDTQHDAAI
jgi:hypothetical protein